MTIKHPLEAYEGMIKTKSACFPGQRVVFRGQDLHQSDLMKLDWIGLHVYGITGQILTPDQQKVINHIWTITSYPDARLWNNRVAALAGTTRSTGSLGVSAAIACTEAVNFGLQPMIHAADFLVRAKQAMETGQTLDYIIKKELEIHKHLGGYGRPVATLQQDERISVLINYMKSVGVEPGRYFLLAFDIEKVLIDMGKKLYANYAAVVMAPLLDFGLTPHQSYLCMLSFLEAGMTPCYEEALQRPAGATFPIRCTNIVYDGIENRIWKN
jgi:hypothetical protein